MSDSNKDYRQLLQNNVKWADEMVARDPEYFNSLTHLQQPKFLWIGCADSRVPANEITGTKPGEIFVHRNVANLVIHTDMNMLTVLQYAVEVLKIEHVIVCGHYGCGGVQAAMGNKSYGLINKWIRSIKDVYRLHRDQIDSFDNDNDRFDSLVEWNVREQVNNLAKTTIIQKSWQERKAPSIHGWIYRLNDGKVKELMTMDPGDMIDPLYHYDFSE